MAEAYVPQGLTPDSFNNMITGAGAAFIGLELEGGETPEVVATKMETALAAGDCLGATRGGFSFDFSYETRSIEADGKQFEFVGSVVMQAMNAQVETTLLEVTPDNFKRVFGTSEYDEEKKRMRLRMSFTKDSYIPKLWIIMALIGGGYVGILFKNALNINGSSPTTTPDGEMELPVTFVGHQGSLTDAQYGPAEIYWFTKESADPETQGASTQSAAVGPTSKKAQEE